MEYFFKVGRGGGGLVGRFFVVDPGAISALPIPLTLLW